MRGHTLTEIKEFCRHKCPHGDCLGKDLKIARSERTFCGVIITPKGVYYCAHKKASLGELKGGKSDDIQ